MTCISKIEAKRKFLRQQIEDSTKMSRRWPPDEKETRAHMPLFMLFFHLRDFLLILLHIYILWLVFLRTLLEDLF